MKVPLLQESDLVTSELRQTKTQDPHQRNPSSRPIRDLSNQFNDFSIDRQNIENTVLMSQFSLEFDDVVLETKYWRDYFRYYHYWILALLGLDFIRSLVSFLLLFFTIVSNTEGFELDTTIFGFPASLFFCALRAVYTPFSAYCIYSVYAIHNGNNTTMVGAHPIYRYTIPAYQRILSLGMYICIYVYMYICICTRWKRDHERSSDHLIGSLV